MENQTVNRSSETSRPARPAKSASDAEPYSVHDVVFRSEPLSQDLNAAVLSAVSFESLLQQLSKIVLRNSECLGLWYSDAKLEQHSMPVPIIDRDEDVLGQLELSNIQQLAIAAVKQKELVFHQSTVVANVQFVAVPTPPGPIQGVLTGCFSTGQQATLRHHWLMTLVGQSIQNWSQSRDLVQSQVKLSSLNDTMLLVKLLDSTETIGASGRAVVNHMRRLAGTEQVAFVHLDRQNKHGRLIAVSDVEQIDETSPVNQAILSVCQSAIAQKSPVVYPVLGADKDIPDSLENYCRVSRLNACIGLPLADNDGEIIGAILVAGEPERLCQPKLVEYLQLVGSLVAGHLGMVLKANQGIAERVKNTVLRSLKKGLGRKVAIVACIAGLALLVPLPYNIGCDCQLEPVVRRFVAAPYDGILEKTFANTGEVVQANQLLARMDGRTLRIELAGLQAEFEAAKKRRDSALATGDIAKSHIARSEMKRHQSQIELLNRRLENLEVKSPIDGIVVSGDLEKVEGAPLETGQTLFEVGPLDQMVAEILVPESEIRFVEAGQSVRIKLNAYPFRTFYGTVKHIHTRSEVVSDKNVFVAEVVMENENGCFKPGMAGTAKISSGVYPVGWNLFHNAWEKVRYWTIW